MSDIAGLLLATQLIKGGGLGGARRRTGRRKKGKTLSKTDKKLLKYAKRINKQFPYKDYGTLHVKRGENNEITYWDEAKEEEVTGIMYDPTFVGGDFGVANDRQKAVRKHYGFSGKGDYHRGGFRRAGKRFARDMFGHGLNFAAGTAKRFMGMGDYTPGANQIVAGGPTDGIVVNGTDDLTGDIYFSHRELVGNVSVTMASPGTSSFKLDSFPINVGMAKTFPFLSQIAQNFTLYELEGCMFEYRPLSGESANATNSLGKIIMATQYDPEAPSFTSSTQMQNYDYANVTKPSCGAIHGVETHPKQRSVEMLYVRTGEVTRDKVFTDIGSFQIATEGIYFASAGTQILGELWVTYRSKLSRAQLFASVGEGIMNDSFYGATTASGTLFANTPAALAAKTWASTFDATAITASTIAAPRKSNAIGGVMSSASNQLIYTFGRDNIDENEVYVLNIHIIFGASPASAISVSSATGTNCVLQTSAANSGLCVGWSGCQSTESSMSVRYMIQIADASAGVAPSIQVVFSGANLNSVASDIYVSVQQIDPSSVEA